jgi:hypothetical protein
VLEQHVQIARAGRASLRRQRRAKQQIGVAMRHLGVDKARRHEVERRQIVGEGDGGRQHAAQFCGGVPGHAEHALEQGIVVAHRAHLGTCGRAARAGCLGADR